MNGLLHLTVLTGPFLIKGVFFLETFVLFENSSGPNWTPQIWVWGGDGRGSIMVIFPSNNGVWGSGISERKISVIRMPVHAF